MRAREVIEGGVNYNRVSGPYMDDGNAAVNLNLENVMHNQGLIIEILLDIRDLLSKKADKELPF